MPSPVRFTSGFTQSAPWHPLGNMGVPNPMFYHVLADDFDSFSGSSSSSLVSSYQLSSIAVNDPGAGFTTVPTVSITGGGGTGATATAILSNGAGSGTTSVAYATLTDQGTGYTAPPTVSITGGGGTGALGIAILNNAGSETQGVVGATITDAGTGYTTPPTVSFSGGGGTGATGTAIIDAAGGVVAIVITVPGVGYTTAPTITLTGGAGTGATATADLWTNQPSKVAAVIITDPGTGYTSTPTITLSGGGGTGATATATLLPITQGSISAIVVNDPGIGYTTVPTVTITGGGGTGATATAYLTSAPSGGGTGSGENWVFTATGTGTDPDIVPGVGGILQFKTGVVTNDKYAIYKPSLNFKLDQVDDNNSISKVFFSARFSFSDINNILLLAGLTTIQDPINNGVWFFKSGAGPLTINYGSGAVVTSTVVPLGDVQLVNDEYIDLYIYITNKNEILATVSKNSIGYQLQNNAILSPSVRITPTSLTSSLLSPIFVGGTSGEVSQVVNLDYILAAQER